MLKLKSNSYKGILLCSLLSLMFSCNKSDKIIAQLESIHDSKVTSANRYNMAAQLAFNENMFTVMQFYNTMATAQSIHSENIKNTLKRDHVHPSNKPTKKYQWSKDSISSLFKQTIEENKTNITHYQHLLNIATGEKYKNTRQEIRSLLASEEKQLKVVEQIDSLLQADPTDCLCKISGTWFICVKCGTIYTLGESIDYPICIICGTNREQYEYF